MILKSDATSGSRAFFESLNRLLGYVTGSTAEAYYQQRAKLRPQPVLIQMSFSNPLSVFRFILFSVAASCLAGVAGCKSDYPSSGKAASPDSKLQPRQVKTVKVIELPIGETVTVNGTLVAYDHT